MYVCTLWLLYFPRVMIGSEICSNGKKLLAAAPRVNSLCNRRRKCCQRVIPLPAGSSRRTKRSQRNMRYLLYGQGAGINIINIVCRLYSPCVQRYTTVDFAALSVLLCCWLSALTVLHTNTDCAISAALLTQPSLCCWAG